MNFTTFVLLKRHFIGAIYFAPAICWCIYNMLIRVSFQLICRRLSSTFYVVTEILQFFLK